MDAKTSFELLNVGLAFVEGLALIISPCILPILPIILASSIEGGRSRPWGVIVGFTLTFALFTLFSRTLVQHFAVDLNLVRHIAFMLVVIFGLILLSDKLTERFSSLTRSVSDLGHRLSQGEQHGGFLSGLLIGGFVSLIWVPCGGPILAAAIVQAVAQKTTQGAFLIFSAFALGSIIPMLLIAYLGKQILLQFSWIKTHGKTFRKVLGLIIVLSAVAAGLVDHFISDVIMPDAPNVMQKVRPSLHEEPAVEHTSLKRALKQYYPAPEFRAIDQWINSPPLKMADLKGKVVLVDFWTYSCINCIRTLPYLKEWHNKYHDKGLVIVGVHSPEFAFEKDTKNVERAVEAFGIPYPVALDNQFGTWTNFSNQFWPAHYLIDKNGDIVYQHFGEGQYDETEYNILALLGMKVIPQTTVVANENSMLMYDQTPETYLGYARADGFVDAANVANDTIKAYTYAQTIHKDAWSLQGLWGVYGDKIVAGQKEAGIKIHFFAKKVYVVMGTNTGKPIRVKALLNGKPIDEFSGRDVKDDQVLIKRHQLYEVVSLPQAQGSVLELIAEEPGVEIYTFTFGD